MELHGTKYINTKSQTIQILRVQNGWIYTITQIIVCNSTGEWALMSSVFVPE